MDNILIGLFKFVMGMKLGWVIVTVLGLIIGGSILRNIISGSFSLAKFASGFNPFAGQVQGKLIYYGLIIFGCFVVYHFIMRPTYSYDTDYRNNIHHNADVIVDQRVGSGCIPTKILWGLITFGCKSEAVSKIVNQSACPETAKAVNEKWD